MVLQLGSSVCDYSEADGILATPLLFRGRILSTNLLLRGWKTNSVIREGVYPRRGTVQENIGLTSQICCSEVEIVTTIINVVY